MYKYNDKHTFTLSTKSYNNLCQRSVSLLFEFLHCKSCIAMYFRKWRATWATLWGENPSDATYIPTTSEEDKDNPRTIMGRGNHIMQFVWQTLMNLKLINKLHILLVIHVYPNCT
jgi:hypothetical protein